MRQFSISLPTIKAYHVQLQQAQGFLNGFNGLSVIIKLCGFCYLLKLLHGTRGKLGVPRLGDENWIIPAKKSAGDFVRVGSL